MVERQLGGVEERAVEPERRAPLAVGAVADDAGGRRRRGGRGSGGSGRSPAGTSAAPRALGVGEALDDLVLGARRRARRRRPPSAVGSPGSRPIGASIDAVRRCRMPPHQGARSAALAVWAANWATSDARAACGAGDDEQPRAARVEAVDDARALAARPTPAMSGKRASRPLTSVPSALPAPGWTTSPAGLSTTITSSSAWTTRELDGRVGAGGGAAPGSSPCRSSTTWPCGEAHLAGGDGVAVDADRAGRRSAPPRRRG